MRLLVIGGTVFLGRHVVETALARGHAVTVFHRGLHGRAHPDAETLIGDRTSDLSALERPRMGRGDRHLRLRSPKRSR